MTQPSPRIGLVHATALAIEPIQAAFARHWPQARRMNLLDDTLSLDVAEAGRITDAMTGRFIALARYAQSTGCEGILFTCSAFGPAIESAGRATGLPTLKPNEAMFAQALAAPPAGRPLRLALVATFQPSLAPMKQELLQLAQRAGIALDLREAWVPEAMDDLAQGRRDDHDRKIAEVARALADRDAVLLAQFSMAAAAPRVQQQLPCPVLTSPDCAVLALQQRMTHG